MEPTAWGAILLADAVLHVVLVYVLSLDLIPLVDASRSASSPGVPENGRHPDRRQADRRQPDDRQPRSRAHQELPTHGS